MGRRQSFFTPEMGTRLRELRLRKRLTQDEVADRMGLRGKGRWNQVAALERGDNRNPSLKLVTYYLKACGALFSEFYDTLTRVELIPVREQTADTAGKALRTGIVPKLNVPKLIEQTEREAEVAPGAAG